MITVACIVKNERDRWLEGAVGVWSRFATRIVCVDDGSDDDSGGLVEAVATVPVHLKRKTVDLYGNSSSGRELLWNWAAENTPIGDWIFILDADMIPASDPRPYLTADLVQFLVFDMWDGDRFRSDAWWTGHYRPRVWAARKTHDGPYDFDGEPTHANHVPLNIGETSVIAELDASLLHYGYSTPDARQRQYDKYMAKSDLLSSVHLFQTKSILHPNPRLVNLPFEPEYRL